MEALPFTVQLNQGVLRCAGGEDARGHGKMFVIVLSIMSPFLLAAFADECEFLYRRGSGSGPLA